jgi:hypothetical protein
VALSTQTNYTDWATTIGRWILVETSADRGMSLGQRGGSPTVINLIFLHQSRYFFFQVASHLSPRVWTTLKTHGYSENFSRAGNRTRDLCDVSQEFRPLDQKGGLRILAVHFIMVLPSIFTFSFHILLLNCFTQLSYCSCLRLPSLLDASPVWLRHSQILYHHNNIRDSILNCSQIFESNARIGYLTPSDAFRMLSPSP